MSGGLPYAGYHGSTGTVKVNVSPMFCIGLRAKLRHRYQLLHESPLRLEQIWKELGERGNNKTKDLMFLCLKLLSKLTYSRRGKYLIVNCVDICSKLAACVMKKPPQMSSQTHA